MSMFISRFSGALLLALVLGCLSALPAEANRIADVGGSRAWSGTHPIGVYEKPCKMKYKKKPAKRKHCDGASKLRMHVSKAHRASARQIARNGELVSPSGTTLREAAKRGTPIKWKSFWQSGITLPGVETLYDEKHEGMAFYNGEDVWIAPNHGVEDGGYHRCGIETQFPGFSVNNTNCSENSKYMPNTGTEYIQFWDYFEIAAGCRWCFPTHFNMHVNIHENGHVSFWWFDDRRKENN